MLPRRAARPLAGPLTTALLAGALLSLAACGAASGDQAGPTDPPVTTAAPTTLPPTTAPAPPPPPPPPPPPIELPRGGRTIYPGFTVVGYYGTVAGRGDLGVLGHGPPAAQTAALEAAAAPFAAAGGRPVLPALELITTVAQGAPGPDGTYSKALSEADVQAYLDAARAARAYLVLDLQPGTARFVDQARRYERFLREPDVGLGLDPEWKLQPGERPRAQIGHTDAAEVNEVGAYLQQLVDQGGLPQKLFVLHQFRASMITDRAAVVAQPGLATVLHVDGFGGPAIKRKVYSTLSLKAQELFNGFKLFYDEDTAMLTPAEAMALVPRPDLVTYQ